MEIKFKLVREMQTEDGMFGRLYFPDGKTWLHTLELGWHNNERGHSCIPVGKYSAVFARSPSKGMCYHLMGTEPRSDILVHSANFAGDTRMGRTSELLGCIALGKGIGVLQNKENPPKPQQAILQSKLAIQQFQEYTNGANISIEIVDSRGQGDVS